MRIILGIIFSVYLIAHAENEWRTVRYFEEISSFDLKLIEYETPLVFDWGNPVNQKIAPEWADLLKTNSDLSGIDLDTYRALFTTNCWPTIGIDESNFDELKKFRKEYPGKYPEARYLFVYAKAYVTISGSEFLYLLTAIGGNISKVTKQVESKIRGGENSFTAMLLKKEDGIWKHHVRFVEKDSTGKVLSKIPISYISLRDLGVAGRSYYDASEKDSVHMKPFLITGK